MTCDVYMGPKYLSLFCCSKKGGKLDGGCQEVPTQQRNTADYFTKGSQPKSFAYTSEKVLNDVFADTEWDFNSDSGENEDFYVM